MREVGDSYADLTRLRGGVSLARSELEQGHRPGRNSPRTRRRLFHREDALRDRHIAVTQRVIGSWVGNCLNWLSAVSEGIYTLDRGLPAPPPGTGRLWSPPIARVQPSAGRYPFICEIASRSSQDTR